MKRATFNVRTPLRLEQRQGYITTLPNYPEVRVCLHREKRSWVCTEYETGAALTTNCPTREDALRDADYTVEVKGMETLLRWMSGFLYANGRANAA